MAPRTKKWSKAKSKLLATLFETSIADPRYTKAADIDPIYEMKEEFKEHTVQRFRENYKTTATAWMTGKAIDGTRLKTLFDAETKDDNGDELDDEFDDDELEEEFDNDLEEEYSEDTETMPIATTTAKKASVVKATAKSSKGLSKYKANESPWHPRTAHHVYPAKGYMRDTLLIEPPGSFTGEEGSYEASFDSDDQEFVFKIPPNPIFIDPHGIHAYQAAHYGRVFADDSAKEQAFKQSSKGKKDKWATFRHQLPFKGTRSEDLGRVPWMDFTSIEVDGKDTPVLIIELRSITPIEEEETVKKQSTGLQMKTFKSPTKIKGVNMASGPTAQMALHIEQLMKNGLSFADIKNAAKRGGLEIDDMVVDGEEKEENSKKKSKGLAGET